MPGKVLGILALHAEEDTVSRGMWMRTENFLPKQSDDAIMNLPAAIITNLRIGLRIILTAETTGGNSHMKRGSNYSQRRFNLSLFARFLLNL